MDYRLSGRSFCVLILMLLEVQGRPVSRCDDELQKTLSVMGILEHETRDLLKNYIASNGNFTDPIPDVVPHSTISGNTISEKLRDIYFKNVLFYLHLLKVKGYQEDLLNNSEPVTGRITKIEKRLGHLSNLIKSILYITDPEFSSGPTPAPLQLPQTQDYEKKVYGWGVIVTMQDWLEQVKQVLVSDKVCDKQKSE